MQQNPESREQSAIVLADQVAVQESGGAIALPSGDASAPPDVLPSPEEHYKIVIEDARALGDRRDATNTMFVNIVSAIAGGVGYVLINQTGTTVGLAVVLAACAFGWSLCRVWSDAIDSYKPLLRFRYTTLKIWEDKYKFPSLRQYYISEDMLYPDFDTPTDLSNALLGKGIGQAKNFVTMYVALPGAARVVFIVLALLQTIAFVWRVGSPFLLQLPLPWHSLPPINF